MSDRVILLVTPHPDVADQIQAVATPLNRSVVRVSHAREALKALTTRLTALVIADQNLPDRSGIDLLQRVHQVAPFAERLLILDPDADAEVAIDALNRAGVGGMIRKPLENPDALRNILRRALNNYALNDQERAAVDTLQLVIQGKRDARAVQVERLCTVGEMAGSLVHKFNNILTILMGHLDILQEETRGTALETRLASLSRATIDGAQLSRKLQEFMRPRPARQEPLSLNQMIQDILKMTEPIWKSGNQQRRGEIRIQTRLEHIPAITGDISELREALTNLILNATDAMPRGGRLTLRTTQAEDTVRIEVEDTGIGMSEEVQERIFEPFFSTKGQQGNGLGLSIVRRIAREHGGDILVESRPGKGSLFTLILPIEPDDISPEPLSVLDTAYTVSTS